ncbi:hypothetical protein [Cryobacterium levicorallinum]|uniref:Uncharacterized protein n=1 Tax=Cryobacterium levicorallinum TaxID=995038 RepID=A0ABY1EBP3_9MICO|nr:hypothetical protein [Cryobacterium levicorallinum]SFH38059.1 hypothetical protein SAMN05216274_10499 [Cryobacterium levicorallinum]
MLKPLSLGRANGTSTDVFMFQLSLDRQQASAQNLTWQVAAPVEQATG